jgi:hypothetical protein
MGVTESGRLAAERRMTLTFAPMEPDGFTTVGGLEVQAYTQHDDTPGKVQGGSASTADPATEYVTVGGVRRPLLRGGLHIPVGAPVPVPGDRGVGWEYECTAVGPDDDPSLLNRRYLVVNAPAKSYATARRLDVVEVS